MNIEIYKNQIILSLVLFLGIILINVVLHKVSKKSRTFTKIRDNQRKIISKIIKISLLVVYIMALLAIWKVNKQDLFVYISSVLGIIGVGFFAQWSLLSNITSGIIIYINHPITIGDEIHILDKDVPIKGLIKDIGLFFMQIETEDRGVVSVPNSLLLQKSFSYIEKE